jgi:hypothetical protein
MEATRSSETSVPNTTTRHQIPEDDFLHSHRRENLKSYRVGRFVFSKRRRKRKKEGERGEEI